MGRPSKYSDEFRHDAVALYRAPDRSSVKAIADRVGVNHETLRQWIKAAHEADSVNTWQLEREILRKADLPPAVRRGSLAIVTLRTLLRGLICGRVRARADETVG